MTSPRILVVRNDKLGDFMLAWPALALLKRSLPDAHLTVLVPAYTHELAALCPWVDAVLQDPDEFRKLNKNNFDAVLTLFSTGRVGWQVWKGRIPLRVAPATKLAQLFYNHRIVQRRSRSEKPEYVYNMELAAELLRCMKREPVQVSAPFWPLDEGAREAQRLLLSEKLGIDADQKWFFVHSGSGGSANNLSIEQYSELICELDVFLERKNQKVCWVLSCGPGETERALELKKSLESSVSAVVYQSSEGLAAFSLSLIASDLMIAGSTGPLHVAGALDIPTVGFFPAKRSATSLRWRPCNSEGNTLSFSPPAGKETATDMSKIDMRMTVETLLAWIENKNAVL